MPELAAELMAATAQGPIPPRSREMQPVVPGPQNIRTMRAQLDL